MEKIKKQYKEFCVLHVENWTKNTQSSKKTALEKFLDIINVEDANEITTEHVIKYVNSKYFKSLSNRSKTLKLTHISEFLKYFKINIDLPEYKVKKNELSKNDLIDRGELERLLNAASDLKRKTMIIVLYESAARVSELTHIKREDVRFHEDYCNIFIASSKTGQRNIPLVESIPFLKQYMNDEEIDEGALLFGYDRAYIYQYLKRLAKRCGLKKKINPHLFRHSRLTELAENRKLNEPQLRRFAGWSKSSNMPAIYFHLDDSSIRNEIINIDKPAPRPKIGFETLVCPKCFEKNSKFSEYCWKCGKQLNDTVSKKVSQEERIEALEDQLEQMDGIMMVMQEQLQDHIKLLRKK